MKKLLLTLALLFIPTIASAQCNGIFPNNTICGNISGAGNLPRPIANSALTGVPGGTNGQIQYNNSGIFGGFTLNGDCTIAIPAAGTITCFISAPNVSFTATGTGAVTRTIQTKANDIVSVQDFGAKCDGATNDTAAFQAAIDAVQPNVAAQPGGKVIIGTYPNANSLSSCVITGPVTLRGRVTLSGNGMGTSITTNHATNDVFVMVAGNNLIENLQISTSVTRSAGAYIKMTAAGIVRNVTMTLPYDGISIDSVLSPWTIEDVNATLVVHRAITCTGTTDLGNINRVVVSGNGHAAVGTSGYWTDRCSDIVITNSQFLSFEHGISLESCASCDISDNQFTNVFLDQNATGLFLSANNASSSISRNSYTNLKTTSSFGIGFHTETASSGAIRGLFVQGHVVYGSAAAGINITGATTDFQLVGGFAAGNTGSGILIGAGVTNFSIVNFKSGATGSFGNNGGFGVEVATGASDNYVITLNNLIGNTGGSKSDGGTGTNKIATNNVCTGSIC